MTTWPQDIYQAFLEIGCITQMCWNNPSTVGEMLDKRIRGQRRFASPSFCNRLWNHIRHFGPQLVLILDSPVVPGNILSKIRNAIKPSPILIGWIAQCFLSTPSRQFELLDRVFYYDSWMKEKLDSIYPSPAHSVYLPVAFNKKRYFPLTGKKIDDELVFAGNCSPQRMTKIDSLRQLGLKVKVFGPTGSLLRHRIASSKINRLYNKYLFVLNIHQYPNTINGVNTRTFEVIGANSLVFSPMVPDLSLNFEIGKEVIAYTSVENLRDQYQYLKNDTQKVLSVIERGYARCLADHTYKNRANYLLKSFF